MEQKKTTAVKKSAKPLTPEEIKKKKALEQTKKFKEKYFEYYDDIKSHTNRIYDW